jgi:hypothetical protein
MEKVMAVLGLVAVAGLAWASPSVPVDEDFSGGTFPPQGWYSNGSGSGSWSWQNNGGYAQGYVNVGSLQSVTTSLYTFYFHITGGTTVHVDFNYKTDGFPECSRYVNLGTWGTSVPYTMNHEWTPFTDSTAPSSSGDYQLEFRMVFHGGSHGGSSVWHVDDVVVTLENTAVSPTSLGRVRALYR